MAGAASTLIKAWIATVLKPQLQVSMREGLPLSELGEALIGYGAGILVKGAGKTPDEVRKVLEDALTAEAEPG
jgi:hypothetical protein